jgi:hypothetical protein
MEKNLENNEKTTIDISNTPEHTQPALELGDVIEISAPSNTELHEQSWAIIYIDNDQIRMVHTSSLQQYTLKMDDGVLSDETIQQIDILCRCKEKGYARQHGLLVNMWVDIHFGGEVPTIISGEITNLEEDMIELTTFPERNIIYIDFEYKGLPLHLPIEKLVLRDRPESLGKTITLARKQTETEEGADEISEDTDEAYMEYTDTGEARIYIPDDAQANPNMAEVLRSMYLDASEFVEEELDDVTHVVEVSESEKRYTLDAQMIDMTDEFVSAVPSNERTPRVFQQIHNLIHKFRELRQQFSKFDDTGNVTGTNISGLFDKPLVKRLEELDRQLRWIMPVVKLQKDIYSKTNDEDVQQINQNDIHNVDTSAFLHRIQEIQKNYSSNANNGNTLHYDTMIRDVMTELEAFHSPIATNDVVAKEVDVKTPMEAVVYNADNFHSTVIKNGEEGRSRFVIQRYDLGSTKIVSEVMRTGKKNYFQRNIVSNDKMNIRSVLVFPEQFVEYSRVTLPGTDILKRAWLSTRPMYLFRMLKRKTTVQTTYVNDVMEEQKYDGLTNTIVDNLNETTNAFLGNRTTIKEYALDPDAPINSTTFHKWLTSILPNKWVCVDYAKKHMQGSLSVLNVIRALEPFSIYSTDVTYSQYKDIRYFVKEAVKKYKAEMKKKEDTFGLYKNAKFDQRWNGNRLENILHSDISLETDFRECYSVKSKETAKDRNNPPVQVAYSSASYSSASYSSTSELLQKIYVLDGGRMYLLLINKLLLSLITPDKIINSVEVAKLDDMTNMEKIRATDCFRRHIVKKYTTLDALRKDNNNDDVYYDKEYDDTPYDILSKYKDKKKEMLPELFFSFFREVLISKHDCPESMASELAETIISGKKRVKEGYALLEVRPTLPQNVDETTLTPKERDQITIESDARKRMQYYKRLNTHWVRDESVDETSFIDNNTLLCNLEKECIQTTPSKVCASNDTAAMRMKAIAANRMLKEFDHRLSLSLEEIEKNIETSVERLNVSLFRKRVLNEVLERKYNDYAVSLGKRAVQVENVESPYEPLRRMIMSQGDFVKRQTDIVRFVENFTREPMLLQNEEQYWMYCKDTNTKLFPLSIYTLARAFVNSDTYNETLDRLCSEIGILSSDGDNIIDKHTQYVLRPMDFVAEEGYDESGFRIVSNQIMEKDVGEELQEAFSKENRVFDSEEAQYAYNIFATISGHIGIRKDAIEGEIEDFVLRITLEMMNDTSIVLSEKSYLKRLEKRAKEAKDKPMIPYKIYRNQLLILCVGCSVTIAMMTMIPSFKTKKTFPGCVQSFTGYPVDGGEENVSGLKYISCILVKSKSSILPWNAIEPWSANTLLKRMKEFIAQPMLLRPDIVRICQLKREYLALHPDDAVPAELNIAKWIQFMPPLVEFSVAKTTQGIGANFESDLLRAIRDGSKSQYESIGILKSKIAKHVYGIVEMIKDVVGKKELLLTTSNKEPFMENACCNEDNRKLRPLSYFVGENALIDNYLKKINDMGVTLRKINALAKPQIMFNDENTSIRRGEMRPEIGDTAIYRAFIHYCNFDRDIPIPKELEVVCNEKPAVYEKLDTLEVKIEKMKSSGKRFAKENLEHLMRIIHQQNQVDLYLGVRCEEVSQILLFKDVLEELDLHNSEIVERNMRELLWATLADYNPRVMVHEDRDSVDALNRYLRNTNGTMYSKITEFLNRHGNLTNAQYDAVQVFIHEICQWKMDTDMDTKSLFTVRQFILNSIEKMANVYPAMKRNLPKVCPIPTHWGLDKRHVEALGGLLDSHNALLRTHITKPSLDSLFERIETRLRSMIYFVKNIPVFAPIIKDGVAFHSLYSKETVYLLLKYCWYSVLYEYAIAPEDPDILAIERKDTIRQHRQQQSDPDTYRDEMDSIFGPDEDINPLLEIELELGDIRKVKDDTGMLLVHFMQVEQTTKKKTNMSYADMKFKTQRKKDKEKKQITDTFERMERDERKVEDMLKHFKIGRWNLGQQKGLFQYSSETYGRQAELNEYLNEEDDIEGITLSRGIQPVSDEMDVNELEQENAMEIEREYETEANDIAGLNEDYTDGRYYDEDMNDEF